LVDEMTLVYPEPTTTDATPVNAEPKAALEAEQGSGM